MTELLDLVVRWVHVIAGMLWIGNSMLFNFLDRNLRPRPERDSYGDIWLIHSGGFYLMEKNRGERITNGVLRLPAPLHWFKWQAYTTWITGALLLVLVYYYGARALLVDVGPGELSHARATVLAVGVIVGGWAIYEVAWRTIGVRWPRVATAVSVVALVSAIAALTAVLNGRAAFVHIGALLGTIMAGNVAFTIMPSQRDLVMALEAGREPSQAIADRAKTRSIHNNYITFPVVALMVSAHFPLLYSRSAAENAVLLVAGGGLVRHFMNTRFTDASWRWKLPATAALTVFLLVLSTGSGPFAVQPHANNVFSGGSDSTRLPDSVSWEDARRIIDRRCTACHSKTPSDISLGRTPAGVAFDTRAEVEAFRERILVRAVEQRTMPPGNKTLMTERDRALLLLWLTQK